MSSTGLGGRLSMYRTGRWVAVQRETEIERIDLLGTAPNRALPPTTGVVAFVGPELWMLDERGLVRFAADSLEPIAPPLDVPVGSILPGYGASATDAIVVGARPWWVSVRGANQQVTALEGLDYGERVIAIHGPRVIVGSPGRVRALDRGRVVWTIDGLFEGPARFASLLFGGRALAVLGARGDDDVFVVLRATGALVHQVLVARGRRWVFAEEVGHAFALDESGVMWRVDLRYGKPMGRAEPALSIEDFVVDHDGRHLVLAGSGAQVMHAPIHELFRPSTRAESVESAGKDDAPDGDEPRSGNGEHVVPLASIAPSIRLIPTDAADSDAPASPPAATVELPALLPLAFGAAPPELPLLEADESPYPTARAHLDALLDLVSSRTALSIADAWNSGRLSGRDATRRPHELEVSALLGGTGGFATSQITETMRQVEARQREAGVRARASAARGIRLPFSEIVRELDLAPVAAQVLLLAAAPALRGEIARLYSVLCNDPQRPIVDRYLIEQIMSGGKSALRDQIARELASDSRLVRHGLIHVDAQAATSQFARLTVPDALLDRLRGLPVARTDHLSTVRPAGPALADLHLRAEVKRELVLALAEARPPHDPLRLVLRGRRGSGRHSLVGAMAAQVGREVIAIDTSRLPRAAREMAPALRVALFRASVHGLIPVLSGLDQIDPTDAELREVVRQTLQVHPGPIAIRTSPEGTLPLDPGFTSVTLPPLSETERVAAWAALLEDRTADVDALASRYRIGPGTIRTVIQRAREQHPAAIELTAILDDQVRQHIATRLDHVANRVTRVAGWEDVALPDEMLDSLREFIARARHRRTVYERWGYDAKMSTSRGLTALFYGPPGTGKTMVAGVIAKELGLEIYRVDLARVVSKWIGETEKNLAEVFDAAEDGQVLVLFDEADSLFAKRTDVKTSNDRYANLEVNYLLQRLDTFEGVAVLTSNLDGTIDPAFKRRLSLRLQFPFPDEEMRIRLWEAHVTPQTPTLGDFDFEDLAHRFPLSGGYIRNCTIRAAFLAAHEERPLSQEHLLRAIQLEYRELGKLSTTSRME